MLVVLQAVQDGVRNAADTDLEGGSVRNLRRDVGADGRLDLGRRAELHIDRRVVALDGGCDPRLVDHRRAIEVRDALVHLGDHNFRRLNGRLGEVGGDVVAAIAVLVRKRAVDARHIDRNLAAADQRRKLPEEARDETAVPLGDILPLVGTQEKTVHEERILVLRPTERSGAFGDVEARDDVHPEEFVRAAGKSLLNDHRDGGASLKEDPVA